MGRLGRLGRFILNHSKERDVSFYRGKRDVQNETFHFARPKVRDVSFTGAKGTVQKWDGSFLDCPKERDVSFYSGKRNVQNAEWCG